MPLHSELLPGFTAAPDQAVGQESTDLTSTPAPSLSVPEPSLVQTSRQPGDEPVVPELPEEPQRDISFKDLAPNRVISKLDIANAEAGREENAPGLLEATKAAWEMEKTFAFLYESAQELIPDDNYMIGKDRELGWSRA